MPEFHDIDLTIADSNTDRAREILCEIRTLQSLTLQDEYYLMGRMAKAELIQPAHTARQSMIAGRKTNSCLFPARWSMTDIRRTAGLGYRHAAALKMALS